MLENNLRSRSETLIHAMDEALGLSFAPQTGTLAPDVLPNKLNDLVEADSTLSPLDAKSDTTTGTPDCRCWQVQAKRRLRRKRSSTRPPQSKSDGER